jgi:hypothetical protein
MCGDKCYGDLAMKPYTDLSNENRPRAAHDRVPRAKWLASMSIVLFIATLPIEGDIDYVCDSLPVILLNMPIWIGVAAVPLLLFVVINGRSALRRIKIRLSLLCFLVLVRISLDLWGVVDVIHRKG